jgi:hypothetical protein
VTIFVIEVCVYACDIIRTPTGSLVARQGRAVTLSLVTDPRGDNIQYILASPYLDDSISVSLPSVGYHSEHTVWASADHRAFFFWRSCSTPTWSGGMLCFIVLCPGMGTLFRAHLSGIFVCPRLDFFPRSFLFPHSHPYCLSHMPKWIPQLYNSFRQS